MANGSHQARFFKKKEQSVAQKVGGAEQCNLIAHRRWETDEVNLQGAVSRETAWEIVSATSSMITDVRQDSTLAGCRVEMDASD